MTIWHHDPERGYYYVAADGSRVYVIPGLAIVRAYLAQQRKEQA